METSGQELNKSANQETKKFEKLTTLIKKGENIKNNSKSNELSGVVKNENEDKKSDLKNEDNKTETSSSNDADRIVKRKIYIRNLEWGVHEHLLKNFLSRFGKVKRCKILRHHYNNKSKGLGYAEFYEETDAENVLKANKDQLILNGRDLVVEYFREKPREIKKERPSSFNRNEIDSNSNAQNEISNFDSKLIEELPYNVLVNIFSNLCLRDLCIVELVCKRWYEIARITWSLKNKMILNEKYIYENYKGKSNNAYGFMTRPDFNFKAFRQIFEKKLTNLKYFEVSSYYSKFSIYAADMLKILSEECPNLIYLNLANLSVSNKGFTPVVKKCNKLKEIDISCCSRLSDASVSKIFQHCPDLEKVNFSNCRDLEGSCFQRLKDNNQKLKSIILDNCEKIENNSLIQLLSCCKNLINLSIKRSKPYSSQALIYLINNCPKLESLLITDSGFDSLYGMNIDQIEFEKLSNLTKLDIGNSNCDNKLVSVILNKMKSLKFLNLNLCSRLTDEMFQLKEIRSPLEDLNLSFLKHISDVSLESLSKVSSTLKALRIKGCPNLTNEGIANALAELSNLRYIDVRLNFQVNNLILDTALSLNYRSIYIICYDTNVDTNKFVFDHENTIKETMDRDGFLFKYKNLSFEAFNTKNNFEDKYNWREDGGFYYIGSPIDSEDESDLDNFCKFYDPFDPSNDYNDEDDNDYNDEDDLEDFLEEDQEMFDELKQ